jgi:cell division protease FtsH
MITTELTNLIVAVDNVDSTVIESTSSATNAPSKMTYGRFLEYLDKGWVKKVDFYNDSKYAVVEALSPELGNRPQRIGVNIPAKDIKLITKLKEAKIDFDVHAENQNQSPFNLFGSADSFIKNIAFAAVIFFGINFLFRRNSAGSSSNDPMGKSSRNSIFTARAKFAAEPQTGVTFKDVAGIDEVRESVEEVVTFLKRPEKYQKVGAKIPKGILLTGPPGTGKTLLAKAIAGEAGVAFFSCSASEFVELYIGVGASRIRDLFKRAASQQPCIIFIDEIDAVGRQRGGGANGGSDEREQTLNQLLTEMDGFTPNNGIIVIAATNRSDILDEALLRPGRFDRQLAVNLPNASSRVEILKVHAKNKKVSSKLNFKSIANRTGGFSGAALANIMNEAAILAVRYGQTEITTELINEAIDKSTIGLAGKPIVNGKIKRLLAFHETGHALAATLTQHDSVQRVSIVPKGRRKSYTIFENNEDEILISRNQLLVRIIVALAGRASEYLMFGQKDITTLAADDIQMSTQIARQMVTKLGMSKVGPIALQMDIEDMEQSSTRYSSILADFVDNQVRGIVFIAYVQALTIIKNNYDLLQVLAKNLLLKGTLTGNEFRNIIAKTKRIVIPIAFSKITETPEISEQRQNYEKIVQDLANSAKYKERFITTLEDDAIEKIIDEVLSEAKEEYATTYQKPMLNT